LLVGARHNRAFRRNRDRYEEQTYQRATRASAGYEEINKYIWNHSSYIPFLVVEVLSPGTEAYDRGQKFIYYRACPSIMEYVLVDTQRQAVDVYRRASANLWTLHLFGSGEQVELASINVSVSMHTLGLHPSG